MGSSYRRKSVYRMDLMIAYLIGVFLGFVMGTTSYRWYLRRLSDASRKIRNIQNGKRK
jgi:hypothetical protein